MGPIEENGSLWEFDPLSSTWSLISPMNSQPNSYPPARSYHSMSSDGKDTIYLHAGCPEQGRLSDFWAFSILSREWTQLPPALGPPRGGSSIAFADGVVYRMNGFDGKTEQGGCLDLYSPERNVWSSFVYVPDGKSGPTPRSVSSLLPVKISDNTHLVTLFGERDPSSLGHQGAGKMLSDAWAFDSAKQIWKRVDFVGDILPPARGWFAADNIEEDEILVQGGLGEANERLGDAWSLSFL
jgi:hypothetical protein